MSRWFRFYDDAINDPKILKLSDKLHRVWIGLLCIASKNNGALPPLEDTALMIRMKPERLREAMSCLMVAGLIDEDETGYSPHNWRARQYKSDVSTARVKRFRNGSRNVSETPPETEAETETEKNTEAIASEAPPEIVSREKPIKQKRARARVPLADDWQPNEADVEHAHERGFLDTQIQTIAAAFKNYHQGKGNLMADWSAAWRTWCDNEIKFGRSNGNGPGRLRTHQDDRLSVSRAADRIQERLERDGIAAFPPRPTLLPVERKEDFQLLPPRRGSGP